MGKLATPPTVIGTIARRGHVARLAGQRPRPDCRLPGAMPIRILVGLPPAAATAFARFRRSSSGGPLGTVLVEDKHRRQRPAPPTSLAKAPPDGITLMVASQATYAGRRCRPDGGDLRRRSGTPLASALRRFGAGRWSVYSGVRQAKSLPAHRQPRLSRRASTSARAVSARRRHGGRAVPLSGGIRVTHGSYRGEAPADRRSVDAASCRRCSPRSRSSTG